MRGDHYLDSLLTSHPEDMSFVETQPPINLHGHNTISYFMSISSAVIKKYGHLRDFTRTD